MDLREELKSAGVYPTGPVSAWPESRNKELMAAFPETQKSEIRHAEKVKASPLQMARGLARNARTAALHGKVSETIRNERYDTCKACPAFIQDSKRCSECGCFMEVKTWLNGNKDELCPLKKWKN